MAAMENLVNNNSKRQEQLQRWEESETNSEPVTPKRERNTVRFQNGCMFLAACSSGDKAEVEKLLKNQRNADINITNVDGLTALHQACIDDNMEMVRFLVEHGAEVNVCDNEGWTPLHATASCGFLDIARYLIDHSSNVAAVNNDGDLPIDITENEDMQNLLQEEMDRLGVDAESARCMEEQQMLEDANNFLASKSVKEVRHSKTGATALHVAAAKGYIKVLEILLKAGADINAEDFDGWTSLHAAVHWNQKEACKLLVEHMCNMYHKNKASHTVFDIAEGDMVKLLEDLKDKQASSKKEKEFNKDIILVPTTDRRQGLTRSMSGDSRNSIISQTSEDERIRSSLRGDKVDNKNLNGVTLKSDNKISDPTDKTKPAAQPPQQLPVASDTHTPTRPPSPTASCFEHPSKKALESQPDADLNAGQLTGISETSSQFMNLTTTTLPSVNLTEKNLLCAQNILIPTLDHQKYSTPVIKSKSHDCAHDQQVLIDWNSEPTLKSGNLEFVKGIAESTMQLSSLALLKRRVSTTSSSESKRVTCPVSVGFRMEPVLPALPAPTGTLFPGMTVLPINSVVTVKPYTTAVTFSPVATVMTFTPMTTTPSAPLNTTAVIVTPVTSAVTAPPHESAAAAVPVTVSVTVTPITSALTVTSGTSLVNVISVITNITPISASLDTLQMLTKSSSLSVTSTTSDLTLEPTLATTDKSTPCPLTLGSTTSQETKQTPDHISSSQETNLRFMSPTLKISSKSLTSSVSSKVASILKKKSEPAVSTSIASCLSALAPVRASPSLVASTKKLSTSTSTLPTSVSTPSNLVSSLSNSTSIFSIPVSSLSPKGNTTSVSVSTSISASTFFFSNCRKTSFSATAEKTLLSSGSISSSTARTSPSSAHISSTSGSIQSAAAITSTISTTMSSMAATPVSSTMARSPMVICSGNTCSTTASVSSNLDMASSTHPTTPSIVAGTCPSCINSAGLLLTSTTTRAPNHITASMSSSDIMRRRHTLMPFTTSSSYLVSKVDKPAHLNRLSLDHLSELPGYGSSTNTPKLGTETDSKFCNRSSSFNFGQDYSGYRSIYASRSSNYVPYYLQRQQKESLTGSGTSVGSVDRPGSTELGPSQDTITTTTTTSSSITSTTTTSNSSPTNPAFRRSYEVPKRDEETETKRKARAKHARQTRRSTQGVSLEDIEKAEESIQHNRDTTSESSTTATQLSSARTSTIRRAGGATDGKDTGISTANSVATTVSAAVSTREAVIGSKDDRSITSGYQRHTSEDKNDPIDAAVSTRTSFRRSREDRAANLLTGSTDLSTSCVPGSQQLSNSQTTEGVTPAPSGRSSLRPTAAYSDVTSSKTDDDSKKNESSGEKKESTSIRARRQRRERRSTGIGLDGEDGENKDNKSDEETNDETDQSSQNGPVTSEPTSFSRQSFRSSDTLDQFYKKKYEDIKGENEQIRKEMEQIKKELAETKAAAERTSRLRDNARNSESDKKRLEKKLADLEEEVKKMEAIKADNLRLKDENGALIRVISKLSKPS